MTTINGLKQHDCRVHVLFLLCRFLTNSEHPFSAIGFCCTDSELSPLYLSVTVDTTRRTVPLVPKSMNSNVMSVRDIKPLALEWWCLQVGYFVFGSALQSMQEAGLCTSYGRDIAFKSVLPTMACLCHLCVGILSSCRDCNHPVTHL